jgi:hypothetical protein
MRRGPADESTMSLMKIMGILLLAASTGLACGTQSKAGGAVSDAATGGAAGGPLDAEGGAAGGALDAAADALGADRGRDAMAPESGGAGGAGGAGCAGYTLAAPPPELLLLFDASGTMTQQLDNTPCGTGCLSKWVMARPPAQQVLTETDQQIAWGLKLFPSGPGCNLSTSVEAPVTVGNAGTMGVLLESRTPTGNSPIRAALQAATQYLGGLTAPAARAIVLLTDGGANCPLNVTPPTTSDDAASIAAAGAALASGFPVFVIGLVPLGSVAEGNLIQLAAAGNGTPLGTTPDYHQAGSPDEIVAALRAIADGAQRCMFTVSAPAGADLGALVVRAGGATIPRDPTHVDGWDLVGGGPVIRLYGAQCAAALGGGPAPQLACP